MVEKTNNENFTHVLYVDDDVSLLELSKQILESERKFKVETAASVDEAFKKLGQFHFDVVVSDYDMPGKNGLQFLEELRKSASSIPFILFTGKGREQVALEALNLGAFRYLNKQGDPEVVYTELASCIQQAADQAKAQNAINQGEERFRAIFEATSDAIIVIDDEGTIANLNEAALEMFRCTREVVGQGFFELFGRQFSGASKQIVLEGIKKFATENKQKMAGKMIELSLRHNTGEERIIEMNASVFEQNNRLYSLALIRDVTERKERKTQQKGKVRKNF